MNAKTRQSLVLSVISLFFVLAVQTARAQASGPIVHVVTLPSTMTWCDDSMINGLFNEINTYRSQNGAAPLSMVALGIEDADLRVIQVANYLATTSSSSPTFDPHIGYDTTAASIGYNIIGENLAWISQDPVSIVYSIWQDPLHIAAMVTSLANVAGVSCAYYEGVAVWTYDPGSCTGAACGTTITPPTSTPTLDSEDWAFLTLINNYRLSSGVGPLQVSVGLQNASQWMSNDMAANNYVSHTDSLGRSTGARLAALGYPYSPWGENIAAGYPDAQDNFNAWLTACDPDSTGACTYAHRSNMLGASYNVIGIARAYNATSTYGWYWTTDFGGYVDQVITPPTSTSAPVVVSFTAAPTSIAVGNSATLSWNITGATTVTINNGVGAVSSVASSVVSPTQTTTYTLTASNGGGSTTASATVTVTAVSAPPTTPTLISAVAESSTEVDLVWTASLDVLGVAGYQIVRNGSVLHSVSGATTSYADTGLAPGTYTYKVEAYDAGGNFSAFSNQIAVTLAAPVVTGKPNLIWQSSDGSVVVWYMGGADGSTYQSAKLLASASSGWRMAAVADLNGDGIPDLVWQSSDGSVVAWYMGGADGSTYQSAKLLAGPSSGWRIVAVADLNRDGIPDLIWQSSDGSVVVWYMGGANGSSYQSAALLAGPSSGWRMAAVVDLNGDSRPDLIWQSSDGSVVVWYMGGANGSTYQSAALLAGPSSGWRIAAVADLNADSGPELIWQSSDGSVVVWYMGGANGSTYQSAKLLSGPSSGWLVVAM